MGSSREMDAGGLLLCRYQAEIFALSRSLDIGSREFIKRFVYSSVCFDLDSLAIFSRPFDANEAIDSLKSGIKASKAEKWSEDELHWVGYIYRYWAYVDGIDTKRVYKMMPPKKIKPFYPLYHGMDPQEAIDIWKKEYNLVPNIDDWVVLYRNIVKGTPR